jgi:hypothetical protein
MRTAMLVAVLTFAPRGLAAQRRPPDTLDVRSPAFSAGGPIPAEYTCDGTGVAPPLSWSTVPDGTQSITILVDDSDAPSDAFTLMLVNLIPPTTDHLDQGAALPEGAIAAVNDRGKLGYTPPCPPNGRHHYHFRVYALDLPFWARNRNDFINHAAGHILATGELVGTYQHEEG